MKRAVSAMLAAVAVPILVLSATAVARQHHEQKGGIDETGPYDVVEDWFKPLHEGRSQCVLGVFAETADRVYVVTEVEVATSAPAGNCTAERSKPGSHSHFVLVVDRNGKTVEEWSQWAQLFGLPHAIKINPHDPEKHVWVVDRDAHQIHEFTHDGKELVMTLGEKGVSGNDASHFDLPADITFLPDGTFFVADGYGNTRIVKFDKRESSSAPGARTDRCRASSSCRTASPLMPGAASTLRIATTNGSRCSTRTASISMRGRRSAAWCFS